MTPPKRTSTIVAFVSAGVLALTGCGGGDTSATTPRTPIDVATDTSSTDPKPTSGRTETREDGSVITYGKIGGPGVRDGRFTFRVTKVAESNTPLQPQFSEPLTPQPGAKWVIVSVTARNDGTTPEEVFCGSSGAQLVDTNNRNYSPSDGQAVYNADWCSNVQPGLRFSADLLFEVPVAAEPFAVALWDHNDPGDPRGRQSWVRFTQDG